MYAQPMASQDLVAARITELHRQAPSARGDSGRARRDSIAAPFPVRRRAGWWLVTLGLRLAVGGPTHTVRSAGAR
jgi:hypothetical protein